MSKDIVFDINKKPLDHYQSSTVKIYQEMRTQGVPSVHIRDLAKKQLIGLHKLSKETENRDNEIQAIENFIKGESNAR